MSLDKLIESLDSKKHSVELYDPLSRNAIVFDSIADATRFREQQKANLELWVDGEFIDDLPNL